MIEASEPRFLYFRQLTRKTNSYYGMPTYAILRDILLAATSEASLRISSSRMPFLRSARVDEAGVDLVELRLVERDAQLLAAGAQRVPAAVLAEHQLALGNADRLRIDDLVGRASP